MTDERFVVGSNEIGEIIVTDVETDRVYRYNDISKFFGLIRLLNEQQELIGELQVSDEMGWKRNYQVQKLHLRNFTKKLKDGDGV